MIPRLTSYNVRHQRHDTSQTDYKTGSFGISKQLSYESRELFGARTFGGMRIMLITQHNHSAIGALTQLRALHNIAQPYRATADSAISNSYTLEHSIHKTLHALTLSILNALHCVRILHCTQRRHLIGRGQVLMCRCVVAPRSRRQKGHMRIRTRTLRRTRTLGVFCARALQMSIHKQTAANTSAIINLGVVVLRCVPFN